MHVLHQILVKSANLILNMKGNNTEWQGKKYFPKICFSRKCFFHTHFMDNNVLALFTVCHHLKSSSEQSTCKYSRIGDKGDLKKVHLTNLLTVFHAIQNLS